MTRPTPQEERANTLTHAVGALAAVILLPFLITHTQAHDKGYLLWAVILYNISLFAALFFSTLYHYATDPIKKERLHVMDHIGIYFLIAGSYTPFIMLFLEAEAARNFMLIIWGIMIAGTIFKIFFTGRFKAVSLISYLAMGWLVVFIGQPILDGLSEQAFFYLVLGGLGYTVGVIFYVWKKLMYHHAIWHICVLVGAFGHFYAAWLTIGGN